MKRAIRLLLRVNGKLERLRWEGGWRWRMARWILENNPIRVRRKFTYWQKPYEVYEIAECRFCKGERVTYSEYVNLMWCYDCEREYYPDHWGVFDGPIPMEVSHMLGVWFHRRDVTGELIKEDDPRWKDTWP